MDFSEITQKTLKSWFWEVRGRKWAPGPLKHLWITAVFTRQRKGAIFLQILEILVNSGSSVNFMGNHQIPRNYTENQKISVFHKSVTLQETFVFLGQIDGPDPWDHQNLGITRIPLNFVKFHYFYEIMLNFSDLSRILVKITFWATWRVPGGPMLKTLLFL